MDRIKNEPRYPNSRVSDMIVGGEPARVVAIEITKRIGDLEHKIRYELDGGAPVEVWQVGDAVYIIPKSEAESGKFPWRER